VRGRLMGKAQRGYFGQFGGMYIPEILKTNFDELINYYHEAKNDPLFWKEYKNLMASYSCRPYPLNYAENLSKHLKWRAKFIFKRRDESYGRP